MILNPFQVRLKDDSSPSGFSLGLIGTVIGMVPTQTKQGVQEVYKVLWFNYDEESGDITPNIDAAAPSSHLATELIGFVDEIMEDDEDEDEDEAEYELEDDEQTDIFEDPETNKSYT